jgi:hypothetical protein
LKLRVRIRQQEHQLLAERCLLSASLQARLQWASTNSRFLLLRCGSQNHALVTCYFTPMNKGSTRDLYLAPCSTLANSRVWSQLRFSQAPGILYFGDLHEGAAWRYPSFHLSFIQGGGSIRAISPICRLGPRQPILNQILKMMAVIPYEAQQFPYARLRQRRYGVTSPRMCSPH